jgi:hypothetical protein
MVGLKSQAKAVVAENRDVREIRGDRQNDRIRNGDAQGDRGGATALRCLARRRKARRLQ